MLVLDTTLTVTAITMHTYAHMLMILLESGKMTVKQCLQGGVGFSMVGED